MLRILLLISMSISAAVAALSTSPPFAQMVLNVGDSFTYTCIDSDASVAAYPVWRDQNDNAVPSSSTGANSRVSTTQTMSGPNKATMLQFSNVELSEDGNYTCYASGAYLRRTVIVTIPPTFPNMAAESSQRLLVNTESTVQCTVNANPFPAVIWYFNDNYINTAAEGSRYQARTSTIPVADPPQAPRPGWEHAEVAVLVVSDVVTTDTGSYRCQATVTATGATNQATIEVLVQVPPEWTAEPQNQQGIEGDSITIYCHASGTPEPTYTWLKSGMGEIVDDGTKYLLTDTGDLTVNNLTPDDDEVYTCIASNDAINSTDTSIEKSIRLEVLVKPTLNPQNNQTIAEATTFSMQCSITRTEASATLTWRRGGVRDEDALPTDGQWPLDSRVSVASSDEGRVLTLTLDPTHYDHSGGWICYAVSPAGNVQVTHFLSVESEPFIDTSETRSRVLSWPGNPVNMTCVVNGYPIPSIRWTRLGYTLNETDHITFLKGTAPGTSVVMIDPAESDFGAYMCKATNSRGDTNFRIDLIEGTVPTEPRNIRVIDTRASVVRLTFDYPEDDGGFEIFQYAVKYSSGGQEDIRYYDNVTVVLLDGLSSNTQYLIEVAAINDRGTGAYSDPYPVTTPTETTPAPTTQPIPGTVPGKPIITSNKDSDAATGTSYRLTWDAPIDDGGRDITDYRIRYAQVDNGDILEVGPRYEEEIIPPQLREFVLQPLNENKFHALELRAINIVGLSEPASINFKTLGGFIVGPTNDPRPEQRIGTLGTVELVAIVVACFIVLLILIDVCCFCMNDCGVLMYFCVNCCGKTDPSSKEEIEMGDEEYGKKYEDEEEDEFSDFDYTIKKDQHLSDPYDTQPRSGSDPYDIPYRYGYPPANDSNC
ncbi:neural cell adhesion molecule 2-like [Diadema antillarum]|uniref:neural cell adhesion molecule 2-like n=1 Tax=Diadema antillarum TaxID=105358 RepID=UPI003A87871C